MKKVELTNQFHMYQFDPEQERVLGQNIFVLYHQNECIVFDTGYERHMEQVLPVLKDFDIKYVIITHFHPDHCYGLNILSKQQVVGSKYSIETLTMFDDLDNVLLIPSILIEKDTTIEFHDHTIKLSLNPGHSNCEMIIDVDGEFLLVGDEYMTSNNKPVLPYVAETIEQHIDSLTRIIEDYSGYTFVPSHGVKTKDAADLKYRIRYLKFAATKEKDINKFYQDNDVHYLSKRWHIVNIRR